MAFHESDLSFMNYTEPEQYCNEKFRYIEHETPPVVHPRRKRTCRELLEDCFYEWKIFTYTHLKYDFQLHVVDYIRNQRLIRILKTWKMWAHNKRTERIRMAIGKDLADEQYCYDLKRHFFIKWKRASRNHPSLRFINWYKSFALPICDHSKELDNATDKDKYETREFRKRKEKLRLKEIFKAWRVYTRKKRCRIGRRYLIPLLLKYYVGKHTKPTSDYIKKTEAKVYLTDTPEIIEFSKRRKNKKPTKKKKRISTHSSLKRII